MPTISDDPAEHTMSFGDHLDELRRRLLFALAVPLPLFIVIFLFSDTLVEWLLLPVYDVLRQHDLPTHLQVLSPPEFLLTKLKLSAIAALVVSTPWILWQAWLFVAPGLYRQERRFVHLLMPGSAVLTVAGVSLLYFVMLPLMLHVLVMVAANVQIDTAGPESDPRVVDALQAAGPVPILTRPPSPVAPGDVWLLAPALELYVAIERVEAGVEGGAEGGVEVVVVPRSGGRIDQSFRVSFVVNFTLILLLGIVIAFQMPLVIVLLGWLDLVSVGWLRQQRRYALLVCGVISALITPADAVSMLMMLAPLYGLYELAIILLVIAPASAVAEGRLGGSAARRGWSRLTGMILSGKIPSGKRARTRGAPPQPAEPAQPEATVARGDDAAESDPDAPDGKEGR